MELNSIKKMTVPIDYEWKRSRRKTIAIQIKDDGRVIVRSPYFVKESEIECFLYEKQDWIRKQQKRVEEIREQRPRITEEMRKQGIEKALVDIPKCVEYYSKIMGVTYGRITIREQKTRWGSCSSMGNLNFNWKLVLMPEEILDYVVVHELAHRKEMNHSERFWKIVEDVLPDYRERREKLKNIYRM